MSGPTPASSRSAPNCFGCRHFAVSWDPHSPYACRLMGFKSKILPAIEVLRADGMPCLGFVSKAAAPLPRPQPFRRSVPEPALDPVPEWADVRGLSTFRRLA